MRLRRIVPLFLLLGSLAAAQTKNYTPEELPVYHSTCTQSQLAGTLTAEWGENIYFPPYHDNICYPDFLCVKEAPFTVNGGQCGSPQDIEWDRTCRPWMNCCEWKDTTPVNPLPVTVACYQPGNTGCFISSVTGVLWVTINQSDF